MLFLDFRNTPSYQFLVLTPTSDLKRLLHNVITNNIHTFINRPEQIAQNSAVLDPKGRIITDLRIVKPVAVKNGQEVLAEDQLWMVLPRKALSSLQTHLVKYSFKKDLQMADISSNFDVFAYYAK